MRDYLTARAPVSLELIKNPAESIHPAVLEELLGAVVTALNEISRNFNSEFPEWQAVFEGKEDYHKVSFLIDRAGDKLKAAKKFINPPLVGYQKEVSDEPAGAVATVGDSSGTNVSHTSAKSTEKRAPSPAAMTCTACLRICCSGCRRCSCCFSRSNAMTDLHRELRQRTFERYQTMRQQLWPFIVSKIVFTVVVLLLCSAVMLGGGGLIFQHSLAASAGAVRADRRLHLLCRGAVRRAGGAGAGRAACRRAQQHRRHGAGHGRRLRVSGAPTAGISARTRHAADAEQLVRGNDCAISSSATPASPWNSFC